MATFEYQKIQWSSYDGDPIDEINKLAKQGWRVVAGGGSLNQAASLGANRSIYSWVIMEREIQNQSNFNKS